ncbi:MAG: hypothetical protein ACPW61_06350 [Methyloligella sp. ZOD6]
MKTTIRNVLLGAGLVGGVALATPALADKTTTSVDPVTGATVTVHERSALLPRNRTREVIVTPGPQPEPYVVGTSGAYGAAPDPYASAPAGYFDTPDPYADIGEDRVIHHREETTIERY